MLDVVELGNWDGFGAAGNKKFEQPRNCLPSHRYEFDIAKISRSKVALYVEPAFSVTPPGIDEHGSIRRSLHGPTGPDWRRQPVAGSPPTQLRPQRSHSVKVWIFFTVPSLLLGRGI